MTDPPEITPAVVDKIFPGRRARGLWGAGTIARYLGVSPDSVRAWAKEPDVPIYQPRERSYYASREELDRWLKTKPAPRK